MVESRGAATESMGGVAVVILAILALFGVMPLALTAIAGIVFGAALLIEGAALAARHNSLMTTVSGSQPATLEFGAGMSSEVVAGVAGIVLGVLALVGVAPRPLLASLVLVGGAGLMFSAGSVREMNEISAVMNQLAGAPRRISRSAVSSATSAQVFCGLAAFTLGILALIPWVGATPVLIMVGLLVLGSAEMLIGSALSGRLLGVLNRRRI
ncbi:MAG TPA: hypothetical protein VGH03_12570 [Caulobacteraceae bacterium]